MKLRIHSVYHNLGNFNMENIHVINFNFRGSNVSMILTRIFF